VTLFQAAPAQEVRPAVADVGDIAAAAVQQRHDDRRAHIPVAEFAGPFEAELATLLGDGPLEDVLDRAD